MSSFKEGKVWFIGFSLKENAPQIINGPVVVLDEDNLRVLSYQR